jgi:hypothetical protein
VLRDYSDLKDLHKALSKMVEEDIGKDCSDISAY